MHYLRPSSLAQPEDYFHLQHHINTHDPRYLLTRCNFMGLGVPAEGNIPQEYPLGSTMSGRSTAVPSSSHTGGLAGMAEPQLSRGSVHCSGIPNMVQAIPARAFPLPQALPVLGDIPTSEGHTGRSCSHTLLDNTKKHFWRAHSIGLFF